MPTMSVHPAALAQMATTIAAGLVSDPNSPSVIEDDYTSDVGKRCLAENQQYIARASVAIAQAIIKEIEESST